MTEEQLEKAKKAVEDLKNIEYTISTAGWGLIFASIQKEINWGFENSVSPQFKSDVIAKPEVYFEHYGYINGLRQVQYLIDKYLTNGAKAAKDIKRWESKKNQAL